MNKRTAKTAEAEPRFARVKGAHPTRYVLEDAPPGVTGDLQRLSKRVDIMVYDERPRPPFRFSGTYYSITDAYLALAQAMPGVFSAAWVKRHTVFRAGRVMPAAPKARKRRKGTPGIAAVDVEAAGLQGAPRPAASSFAGFLRDQAQLAAAMHICAPTAATSSRLKAACSALGGWFHTPTHGAVACYDVAEDLWLAWVNALPNKGFDPIPAPVLLGVTSQIVETVGFREEDE